MIVKFKRDGKLITGDTEIVDAPDIYRGTRLVHEFVVHMNVFPGESLGVSFSDENGRITDNYIMQMRKYSAGGESEQFEYYLTLPNAVLASAGKKIAAVVVFDLYDPTEANNRYKVITSRDVEFEVQVTTATVDFQPLSPDESAEREIAVQRMTRLLDTPIDLIENGGGASASIGKDGGLDFYNIKGKSVINYSTISTSSCAVGSIVSFDRDGFDRDPIVGDTFTCIFNHGGVEKNAFVKIVEVFEDKHANGQILSLTQIKGDNALYAIKPLYQAGYAPTWSYIDLKQSEYFSRQILLDDLDTIVQIFAYDTANSIKKNKMYLINVRIDAFDSYEVRLANMGYSELNGEAATISIGSVQTGEYGTSAQVTNTGTDAHAKIDFVIPQGKPALVKIGKVVTIPPDSEACVVNVGTENEPVFDFYIPEGVGFKADKTYSSVEEMNANFETDGVRLNGFVIIDTGNVEDEDNAKLYIKKVDRYEFLTDLSGAQGIKGNAATIEVDGTVEPLEPDALPAVENIGTENAALLKFKLPKGATVNVVEEVAQLAEDEEAHVENIGNEHNVLLKFSLPKGKKGDTGDPANIDALNDMFVNKSGDTMDGPLAIDVQKGHYNEGIRINSDNDWALISLGADRGTVSGADTDKGFIIGRPADTDYLIISGHGNEADDANRVRITKTGELYEKGARVFSPNNLPTSVKDFYNGQETKLAYSQDGLSWGSFTWLAGWNGYELRAVSKPTIEDLGLSFSVSGTILTITKS